MKKQLGFTMIALSIKIMEIPSTKSQISNKSQSTKFKIQNNQNGH